MPDNFTPTIKLHSRLLASCLLCICIGFFSGLAYSAEDPQIQRLKDEALKIDIYGPHQSKAYDLYKEIITLQLAASGTNQDDLASTFSELATLIKLLNKFDAEAIDLSERHLAFIEKAYGMDNDKAIDALEDLSALYEKAGKKNDVAQVEEKRLGIQERIYGPENLKTKKTLASLTHQFFIEGKHERAIALYKQHIAALEKTSKPAQNSLAEAWLQLAKEHTYARQIDPAIASYQKFITLTRPDQIEQKLSALEQLDHLYAHKEDTQNLRKTLEQRLALILGSRQTSTNQATSKATEHEAKELAGIARRLMTDANEPERAAQLFEQVHAWFYKPSPEKRKTDASVDVIQGAAKAYAAAGLYDKAIARQSQLLELYSAAGKPTEDVREVQQDLVFYYERAGKFDDALTVVDKMAKSENLSALDKAELLDIKAGIYLRLGKLIDAENHYRQSLSIHTQSKAPSESIKYSLLNLASIARERGEFSEALRLLKQAEEKGGAMNDIWPRIGILYIDLGQIDKGKKILEHIAATYRELASKLDSIMNPATDNLSRSVAETTRKLERKIITDSSDDLGVAYLRIGDLQAARELFEQALRMAEKNKYHISTERLAQILSHLAEVLLRQGGAQVAVHHLQHAENLANRWRRGDPLRTSIMLGMARAQAATGKPQQALLYFERALEESQIGADPLIKTEALYAYAQYFAARGQQPMAILLGKSAVNQLQAIRQNILSLDQSLQRGFVVSKEQYYHTLADLLFAAGRLAEGQQIVAMLKEEEFHDFIRRDGAEDARKTQAKLTEEEKQWAARFAAIRDRQAKIGLELEALDKKAGTGLNSTEQARRKQLESDREVSIKGFERFLDQLMIDLGKVSAERNREIGQKNLADLAGIQDTLSSLGQGSVVLHYLTLDARTYILLTTPQVQIQRETKISAAELNRKIAQYREVLQDPPRNPLPLAQELYRLLIGPVEQDLRQAQAQTLMLSLDGALRYLPYAALHDGKQYLVERYRLALYTEAAKDKLKDKPNHQNAFAGLGVTREVQKFAPLPWVKSELEGILKSGAVKGEMFLDEAFTVDRLRASLDKHASLLHIASHFVFTPGTEVDSFLLMGDGGRLSLADMRRYRFRDVDLITLSACETALGGGRNENGREIEGFAVLAQRQGAKGVMATLWPVADDSTGLFMQNFYKARASVQKTSKAEALRQTQIEFIRGENAVKKTFAHPYYWAPFILMGNWL